MENEDSVDQQNTTDNRNSSDNPENNSRIDNNSLENDVFDDTDPNLRKDKKDPKRTLFY